ncbi:MAG: LOG family protein [Halopseudomonas sp.]|uniref:LOG family protein n=1 Tax=Halopseudomonas sp. TaxID=2901191 RepID=UPI003002F0FD
MNEDIEPADYLSSHWQTGSSQIPDKVEELVRLCAGSSENAQLYRDMLLEVIRMAQADRNRWDAKILLQTIRELERSFARLALFKRRRKVTVFGSARTAPTHALYHLAKSMGQTLSRNDYMTITGGGAGIMAAAHEGAGVDNSLGFNITLPFEQHANTIVRGTEHELGFKFFFLRKLFFVKEADALILCPGGFGTLDETLEVLTLIQTGKSPLVPVVLLDEPGGRYWESLLNFFREQLQSAGYIRATDFHLLRLAKSSEAAMQEILDFYRNFHSARWLGQDYLLRLNQPLHQQALQQLQTRFADVCRDGGFIQQEGDRGDEMQEPDAEFSHLPRLRFRFNGRDHGTLRTLVDFINQPENLKNPGTA